jgi:alpha-tubulin suppressor-like RCC1 family protein
MRIYLLLALVLTGCPNNNGNNNTPTCPSQFTTCAGVCTATQLDPANCGMCGKACGAGESCKAGVCQAVTVGCPTGSTMCGTTCVATASDNKHCGGCNKPCAAGQMCSAGSCAATCATGYMTCTDHCADVANDSQNCGSCGNVCPTGQRCVSGSCTDSCAEGRTPCNGGCVDTMTDAANCGMCGMACPTGEACQAGACGCGISGLTGGFHVTCGVRDDQRVVCTSAFNFSCWEAQMPDGQKSACAPNAEVGSLLPWVIPDLTSVVSFTNGSDFGCAIRTDGTVWCLGSNRYGRLGNGEVVPSPKASPVQVMVSPSPSPLSGVKQVAGGGSGACAVKTNGELWCWGGNDYGQLGSAFGESHSAVRIVLPGGPVTVKKVAYGYDHVLAIDGDDTLWCWGRNDESQCGSDVAGGATPTAILSNVKDVASKAFHSCALLADNTLRCWGANDHAQTSVDRALAPTRVPSPTPVPLVNVAQIVTGHAHSCARTTSGAVFCWGRNVHGQLGDGKRDLTITGGTWDKSGQPSPSPQPVKLADGTALNASDISASHVSTCAVVGASQHPYCWGNNKKGQAGLAQPASDVARPILSCGY